jgi:hypothetical protein
MKVATRDRGEILHFAGRHSLSPALRAGIPTFVSGPDPSATRCGWETFFRAMGDRGLAVVLKPDDAASAEFRPLADVRDVPRPHGSLGSALEQSRRFWRALFPR